MGVIKGSITVAESQCDVAYSEDDDVVAGPEREGCGWCPVAEFVRVGPRADILTVRTMHEREFTRHRDLYAAGEATSHVFVAKTCVVAVKEGSKKKLLEGKKAAEWVGKLSTVVPSALDLLARRQIHVSQLRDPHELYRETRVQLGYPATPKRVEPSEEGEQEVTDADGATKSEQPAGG